MVTILINVEISTFNTNIKVVTIWLHVEISTFFWLQLGYNLVTRKIRKKIKNAIIYIYFMSFFIKLYNYRYIFVRFSLFFNKNFCNHFKNSKWLHFFSR